MTSTSKKKTIGLVIGNTSIDSFHFASKTYISENYVQVKKKEQTPDGKDSILLCRIISKKTTNKYFSNSNIVHYISESDNDTFSADVTYEYEAKIVACIDDNKISNKVVPAIPGDSVYLADDVSINTAYGMPETGIKVGELMNFSESHILLDPMKIFNPHMVILGKTGSGKSYFARGLIPPLLKAGYRVIVFSPSDEYNELSISSPNLNISILHSENLVLDYDLDYISHFFDMTASEEQILDKLIVNEDMTNSSQNLIALIKDYYSANSGKRNNQRSLFSYTMAGEIRESLPLVDIPLSQSAQTLIAKLKKKDLFFSTKNKTEINGSCIIDMSGNTQDEQECFIYYYLSRLLAESKKNQSSLSKTIIFLEEAHNYVPSVKSTLCKNAIVKLAREGRKFQLSLCFITQRPRNFDQTALSQISNTFIFSTTHPEDIQHVLEEAVYYNSDTVNMIQRLHRGECVVNGSAFNDIVNFKVNFSN